MSYFCHDCYTHAGADVRGFAANVISINRTLVYFEGDASMNTYEDKNGQTQSALNLVQTKVEVLKRAQPKEEEQ